MLKVSSTPSLVKDMLQKENVSMEILEKIFNKSFENIFAFNDLSCSRLTPRILPEKLLGGLLKSLTDSKNSIFSALPLATYEEARVSIVSANRQRRTIRLLIAFPSVSKRPEYIMINFLSPKATIRGEGTYHGLQLHLDSMSLALPVRGQSVA